MARAVENPALPEVTEAHRLAAFNAMRWAGWTFERAQADPIRSRLLEARAHQLRTQQWQQTLQPYQRCIARWFDGKAAAAGPDN
jgi:hypothetical protein